MRLVYGEGAIVAILAPVVVYLVGIISVTQMLFLSIVLFGLWTIASAILFASGREKLYYFAWGLVIASVSTAFVIQLAYSAALVLISIIAVIIYSASQRK
ncbi:MAG: hypothetical protein JRN52_00910 [Nitrososphaerota archaeon]|nr:hypothetical protein [Nitrososphaerota archaeon]